MRERPVLVMAAGTWTRSQIRWCAALLDELDIDRAHVVGLSFSGAIALQLASELPARTHSLTLIEPPPVHIPSADAARRGHVLRHRHPGVARVAVRPEDAARIECPVLYVGGSESGPWFAEVHDLILAWTPHAQDVILDGADHSLALTHAPQIADPLHAFLERNPDR